MDNRLLAGFAIVFAALILTFGCTDLLEEAQGFDCDSSCAESVPNSFGSMQNGTCACPCYEGYVRYNHTCLMQYEYDRMLLSQCDAACENLTPHSMGEIKNGSCKCSCEKGYWTYNKSCFTPEEYAQLGPLICPKDHPVLKSYGWAYHGKDQYISLCYENKSWGAPENRSTRQDYWNFVNDPDSNVSVSIVTDMLTDISGQEGFSEYERVEFAIAFVQSLPYTYDNVSTPYDNYPRYPAETIYVDGGDCEDTSILMAAVFRKMGYDVVLLLLPKHMAVGVACNPSDFDYNPAYYPYDGTDYCYLETTGEGYRIGELPESYAGGGAEIIPIRSPAPDLYIGEYKYAWVYDARDMYVNVTGIRIDNFGPVEAKNVKIDVGLEKRSEGQYWDVLTLKAGNIQTRGWYNANFTNLHVPSGQEYRISVVAHGDNFETVESKGNWVTWQ